MAIQRNDDGTFTISQAIYSTDYGILMAFESKPTHPSMGEYVQLSEQFTVTVKALPDAVVMEKQVEALNAQKTKLRADFHRAMDLVDCKLSELLCISHVKGNQDDISTTTD